MPVIKEQATYARVGPLDRMNRADEITAAALHERYLEDVYR